MKDLPTDSEDRMSKGLKMTGCALIIAASLSGCGMVGSTLNPIPTNETASTPFPPPNTDPKVDWVEMFPEDDTNIVFSKRCDGPRIIYRAVRYETVSFTVLDNAAECV